MKKTIHNFIVFFCLFMASSIVTCAQAGSLDTTFDADGKVTTVIGLSGDAGNSVAIQNDGKIVVAGYSSNGSDQDFAVVRYNSNGTLDSTFDADGKATTAFGGIVDAGQSVAIQNDGKIVVAGFGSPNSDFAVVRYNSNGSLDSTFDSDGIVTTDIGVLSDDYGYSVAIQNDGKIVVAGCSLFAFVSNFAVVRYNSNGTLDSTFDADGKVTTAFGNNSDAGLSVAIQNDGKIVVAGSSLNGSNYVDFAIVRYNSNGTLDSTFDTDGKVNTDFGNNVDNAFSVALQSDGKIMVVGYSYNGVNNDFALVRYNIDGTLDSTFDSDGMVTTDLGVGDDAGFSVALQSDGKIVVAGYSYNGFNYDFAVVRYNINGTLDSTFDADGKLTTAIGNNNANGFSVAIQSDGKIVVAGIGNFGANSNFAVVRYNGDNGVGIIENTSEKNTIKSYPNPFSNEIVITGTKEKGEITIFNLMGEEMMKQQTFNTEIKINTENFLPGLYFLKYTIDSKNENVKLLKL